MSQMRGTQSIEFDRAIYVSGFGAVVGKKEGEGPLGAVLTGLRWIRCAAAIPGRRRRAGPQTEVARLAVKKAGLSMKIRVIYAGGTSGRSAWRLHSG